MARTNNHPDNQTNKNPKKRPVRELVKIQQLEAIKHTTIFDIAFKSDIDETHARLATPESEIVKLGKECLEWAKGPREPIKIREFFRDRNYDYDDIERFRRKSPLFSRYYEMALDVIGDRREAAAYNKKASENIVAFTMTLYDQDWRRLRQEKAELARQEASRDTGNIIVKLEPIPNHPDVPHKPDKEPT